MVLYAKIWCGTQPEVDATFFLMFMRRPHSVIELQIETPMLALSQNTEEFVEEVSERMRTAYAFVREHLKFGFDRAKQRYDSRIKSMQFKVGDFVWYYMQYGAGLNRKWMLVSQGPYCITHSINDINKVIQRNPTSKPIIVHIDRLTHYRGDIPKCWLSTSPVTQCVDNAASQSELREPFLIKGPAARHAKRFRYSHSPNLGK